MRMARVLAAAAAAMLAVAGCGSGDGGGNDGNAPKKTVLHSALGQSVDTLLPADSNVGDNIGVDDVLFSGLVRYDIDTGKPYNYMAQSITSTDNTTWTIKIKKGWTFQNGEPVDANAYARAWNAAAFGPNAFANNYFFDKVVGYDKMQGEVEEDDNGNVKVLKKPSATELSGLKVVDDHTLRVTLNTPFAAFPTILGYTGFFPMAEKCAKDLHACAVKPIGNGPFKVVSWDRGQKLVAERWKGYKGSEKPSYDSIEWREYGENEVSWPDFQSGDIDLSAPPPEQWASAMNDPELKKRMVKRPTTALTYLGFPLYAGKPWTDPNFRKAIALAVDVDTIIKQVAPGRYSRATGWVPTTVFGGRKNVCDYCRYDPAEAKKLLAKAGGWPKGKVMKIALGSDTTQEAIFKAIGDQLKLNLGINYSLVPSEEFFSMRSAQKFQGPFRNNWYADYNLNENYLRPVYASGDPKGNTNFGYYDKKFEAKLDEADRAANTADAVKLYQQAEDILAADFPTVPLYVSDSVTFYSDRLDNVKLNPFSGAVDLRILKIAK
ncbi:ABC transporter substrate-binding protein [Actinopolymorpha rutila]|uniref:Peptide/nickel transport system substrate-binding protein/oligopeptide transport system substrate-binding protein n=1 Tax=Actinopolymorpha rutila TaxID=446787 RepID=A0A852Z600_9ACTN|nr:ABC transporter substrate-binding protein [Actinopolymorpha rutila]NYH88311.1 peptide/nickel transport system substrate-binding protein/oligopeptide transport system substrate-binding protein [Actinopolymorpha rutila]